MKRYQNSTAKIVDAFFTPTAKYIEAILALLCFMLGAWVINPGHVGFSPYNNYSVLLAMFPESIWGIIFLVISALQFAFIKCSVDNRILRFHRKAILLVEFCIWIAIASSFLFASQSTAVPTYTTIALLTAYAMIRVGHNE